MENALIDSPSLTVGEVFDCQPMALAMLTVGIFSKFGAGNCGLVSMPSLIDNDVFSSEHEESKATVDATAEATNNNFNITVLI